MMQVKTEIDETEIDETEIDETEIDETEIDETEIDETEIDETEIDETEMVPKLVESLIHNILDTNDCLVEFVDLANKNRNENFKKLNTELNSIIDLIENSEIPEHEMSSYYRELNDAVDKLKRYQNSNVAATLKKSLFINLFAIYDNFVGDLITVLYNKKVELFNSINREISLSKVLQYSSIEEIREIVLDKEIETIRRKSYSEQFKELEKMFSINTLTKFKQWPDFIESSQRRNLFTHCDGIVSEQYLNTCKSIGYKSSTKYSIGDKLDLNIDYFIQSSIRIIEVSTMLAQTLWRKVCPDEIEVADNHLMRTIYDLLEIESWGNAISLSNFALSQKTKCKESITRVNIINQCIALKALNKKDKSIQVLNSKDWSSTIYDFQLAYAVLTENYSDAKRLMIKLGKSGEYFDEYCYHIYPLFKDFRNTKEFMEAYEVVFGYKYVVKLASMAIEDTDV